MQFLPNRRRIRESSEHIWVNWASLQRSRINALQDVFLTSVTTQYEWRRRRGLVRRNSRGRKPRRLLRSWALLSATARLRAEPEAVLHVGPLGPTIAVHWNLARLQGAFASRAESPAAQRPSGAAIGNLPIDHLKIRPMKSPFDL